MAKRGKIKFIRSRLSLAVLLGVIGVVGNMRPVNSEAASQPLAPYLPTPMEGLTTSSSDSRLNPLQSPDSGGFGDAPTAEDASEALSADGVDDDGEVVPAIYAWDPDVRFVYHRHVSKWM